MSDTLRGLVSGGTRRCMSDLDHGRPTGRRLRSNEVRQLGDQIEADLLRPKQRCSSSLYVATAPAEAPDIADKAPDGCVPCDCWKASLPSAVRCSPNAS